MTQYIDKSALVAEIERRKEICKNLVHDLQDQINHDYYLGKAEAYKETLDFLGKCLEVEEVDLDRELSYEEYIGFFNEHQNFPENDWGFDEARTLAEYFFELGLRAIEAHK